tara:strand:+ start:272 stop:823 length:552 start_codon:yes stop_codon:yes gene_type:complete
MEKPAKWLNIVAKQHDKWIKLVQDLGESNFAEDIVQEAYIVLYKYTNEQNIIKNGKVSEGYMFFTLRSVLFQYYNAKNKLKRQDITDVEFFNKIPDVDDLDIEKGYNDFCVLLDKKVDTFHWYDKKLWKLYSQTNMSIRKIASETKISWVSIFNTLKNIKNDLREDLKEDYEDWKNKDFEHLK